MYDFELFAQKTEHHNPTIAAVQLVQTSKATLNIFALVKE